MSVFIYIFCMQIFSCFITFFFGKDYLYSIVGFFVDQLTVFMWVYFRALYSSPLSDFFFFKLVLYCLDNCSFIVITEVG